MTHERHRRNYTFEGYHPDDGLKGGQWVRSTWGVVRWDGHIDRNPPTPVGSCHGCGCDVGTRTLYCRPCKRQRDTEHMRRVRAS